MNNLNYVDVIVLVAYFLVLLGVAYWASARKKEESADYFLAGRETGWFLIGASLFVSNIGSEHLVGLAGSGAAEGMAVGHFEWIAGLILLLLAWLFVPFYLRSGVFTMPEFLERRYNRACRWYFTTVSIIGYVLTKISVALFAGGVIIRELTGLSLWYSAAAIIIVTGVYTVAGGLRAVLYTEAMQAVVLIAGMGMLIAFGLHEVGGWAALHDKVPAGFFSMWKPMSDPDFPWTGIAFGAPIVGVWYWCTDQYIVQRVLAARDEGQAQSGAIFAGYLKILPVFLFVLPGIIAAALYAQIHGGTADQALPTLVLRILPMGLRGFLLAALLAALMSSLSSIFNSCSTLITWDVYRQWRPDASERTLITVGRVSTVVLVALGLLWIPLMKYVSGQLYIYLQSVQGYIAPPIAACFLFGLFAPALNGKGAFTSLIVGFAVGALRLTLELVNGTVGLPEGSPWHWFATVNFLHFAVMLFVLCTAVLFGVSLATRRPDPGKLRGLTFETLHEARARDPGNDDLPDPGVARWRRWVNVALSAGLVLLIAGLWTWFR